MTLTNFDEKLLKELNPKTDKEFNNWTTECFKHYRILINRTAKKVFEANYNYSNDIEYQKEVDFINKTAKDNGITDVEGFSTSVNYARRRLERKVKSVY